MKIRMGINPYGLSYHLGLHAADTPRANPNPAGLEGFLALAEESGARVAELADRWLGGMDAAALATLRERLAQSDLVPVISSGLHRGDIDACIRWAKALGAKMVRVALTTVLCGDRAGLGERWGALVAEVRSKLDAAVPKLEAAGLTLLIENHQDFTSRELVGFCEEFGPSVRIVYDTANSFPVAESPLDFTRVVAPFVRYLHCKDYRVQLTDEGIRLVRCPTGDGAVPLREIITILGDHHDEMLAAIEIGALEARHVRLLTPAWWQGYEPRSAESLAACLLAARRNRLGDDEEWRTPWERGADGEVAGFELAQLRRSVENMKRLGLL